MLTGSSRPFKVSQFQTAPTIRDVGSKYLKSANPGVGDDEILNQLCHSVTCTKFLLLWINRQAFKTQAEGRETD